MGRTARLGCLRKGRGRPVGTDWLSALLLFLGGPAASERYGKMGAQAACRSSAKGRPVGTDWLIRIAPLAAWGMRALTNKN